MKGLLIQEVKTLFKSPASLSILVIPIVLMLGLGFILPSGWIIPSSITIGIVGSVLLYFGGSIEEIKRTSFMKSISLTKMNKFSYLSTKLLFSIVVSLFSVLWVLFFGWFFSAVIPMLVTDFSSLLPESENAMMNFIRLVSFEVNWSSINWILMLYAGAITIIVSTSLAFVFVAFSKSSLSFYLMSFGYLLAMILFGGIIMPSALISEENSWFKIFYYFVPNFYTNNVMASSFGNGLDTLIQNVLIPLDKVIDIDYIRLGYLFEMLENMDTGNISDILGLIIAGQIFDSLFKNLNEEQLAAYNAMTPEDFDAMWGALNSFFSGDDIDQWGLLGKLGIDSSTLNDFEKKVYDVIIAPLGNITDKGDHSYGNLISEMISTFLGPYVLDRVVDMAMNNIILPIMNNIIQNGGSIPEKLLTIINTQLDKFLVGFIQSKFNIQLGDLGLKAVKFISDNITVYLGKIQFPPLLQGGGVVISSLLKPLIDSGMVIISNDVMQLFLNGDWFSGWLAGTINGLVTIGDGAASFTQVIQGAIDKFMSDFSPATTWDYVVPWIETVIFLGISTVFFKWS